MASRCRAYRVAAAALMVFLVFTVLSCLPAEAGGPGLPTPGTGGERIARGEGFLVAQAGQVTPEKLERWRKMTPEERKRIRERYRRWKALPPERRERILERRRTWSGLPGEQRRFLMERREIYRNAGLEERRAIEKFVRRLRQLPPERRHAMRRKLADLRSLPAPERDERMMEWPFYRRLSPDEKKAVSRFLFSDPPAGPRGAPPGKPHN